LQHPGIKLFLHGMKHGHFSADKLRKFAQDVFLAIGCSDEHAQQAADVLISSDLRGIDSHGLARLSGYVRLWEAGRINTKPKMKISREKAGTATIDADSALGLVSAPFAMKLAIEKAEACGSGWVAVQNSNHFGIAAYHALMAVEHRMIGFASTNASPLVSPTFSNERMLGTNPVCYAFPAGKFAPIVMDLATSAAANGKLEIAKRENKAIPDGWLVDKHGNSSRDPSALGMGGALLPLGSDREHGSHKGYALSAMVDLMSGVLSGANYGPWVPPFVSFLPVLPDLPGKGLGHFLGVWDVEGFRPYQDYLSHVDQWISRFKAAGRINQDQKVVIPGEPEAEAENSRSKNGIPLNDSVLKDLMDLSTRFHISF
jgi:LDH2 family malate/lactate/ureidoglycolate dehydrogenase